MEILIEPCDVLLFRDGRPFGFGERALPSPFFSPLTFWGAVGAFLYREQDVSPEEIERNLKIKGPFILKGERAFFHPPADLGLSPLERAFWETDMDEEVEVKFWVGEKRREEGKFIPTNALRSYLLGEGIEKVDGEELFVRERRPGVQLGEGKVAREGRLYSVDFVRPQEGTAFLLEVEGFSLPESGALLLGGEGKAASFRRVSPNPLRDIQEEGFRLRLGEEINRRRRFKIVLLTPAFFDSWKPEFEEVKVEFAGAAMRRPFALGGWDYKARRGRTPRKAVPPGSVYYFKLVEGDPLALHLSSVSSCFKERGMGICAVGVW